MIEQVLSRRLTWMRIVVCLAFLLGILLSFKVWHSDRLFPLLPVLDEMPSFSAETSGLLAVLLVLLLLLGALVRVRLLFVVLLSFLLLLLLQDQMRWQPWVYMYVALLVPFALWKKPTAALLPYFQFVLIGVYFWSGLYKIGDGFITTTFDKMLETLFLIESAETRASLHFLGYGVPLIEMALAIGFIFPKTRKTSLYLAVGTHVIILSYLIINHQNTVVYPWNIAMVLLAFLAFYKTENSLQFWKLEHARTRALHSVGALLFLVLPATNPLGLWDTYLSFKLYSGTNGYYCIGVDQDQYKKLDTYLQACFWRVDEPQGKYWIYVNFWAFQELNVAFYPEERTYKALCSTFCDNPIPAEKFEFVKFTKGFSREGAVIFNCEECR